jgi:hypothetical protein
LGNFKRQENQMLERLKRRPGGQPNNKNALKTGRWTKEGRAAHAAALEAAQEAWREECRRSNEWIRQQPGYVTDYGKILDELARWKRARGIE